MVVSEVARIGSSPSISNSLEAFGTSSLFRPCKFGPSLRSPIVDRLRLDAQAFLILPLAHHHDTNDKKTGVKECSNKARLDSLPLEAVTLQPMFQTRLVLTIFHLNVVIIIDR